MTRNQKKYLFDIWQSLEWIFTDHLSHVHSVEDFKSARTAKRAIEREIGIIGEAVYRLKKSDREFPISAADVIVNFRNTLIHQYDAIKDERIWEFLHQELIQLKEEVDGLM